MRRKDREMNKEFALEIIDKSQYGVVSMLGSDHLPYGLPLSIVRAGNSLYFHSAKQGKKIAIFEKNPEVSIAFIGEVQVPENYTTKELEEIIKDESQAMLLISKVFTTEYASALVTGKVKLVHAEDEKKNALKLICEKYTPTKMDYFPMALKAGLAKTNVYVIDMEKITAKRKKFDPDQEEMKWGRMI